MEGTSATTPVLVCLLLLCLRPQEVTSLCMRSGQMSEGAMVAGRLEEATFLTVPVPSLVQCLDMCLGRTICLSVNYNAVARLCELNHEAAAGSSSPFSTNASGWTHVVKKDLRDLNLAGICTSEPCSDEEICIPIGNEDKSCVSSGITCRDPLAPQNGSVEWNSTEIKAEAVYNCSFGFRLQGGSSVSTCRAYGKWRPVKYCQLIDCGSPPVYPLASVTSNGTLYLAQANYSCDLVGYKDEGTLNVSTCQEDLTWSQADVQCRPVDCGPPPEVPNAQVQVMATTYDYEANYSCVLGYEAINGSRVIRCQASGEWQPPSLQCEPVDCGPPPAYQNATANYSSTLYDSTVTYSCPPKFEVSADSSLTRRCGADGRWYPLDAMVFCSPISCYIANSQAPWGYLYRGTVSVDVMGRTCQRWDSQSPYGHGFDQLQYHVHDGGASNSHNYCRFLGLPRPMCITTEPGLPNELNGSYAYCPVPLC